VLTGTPVDNSTGDPARRGAGPAEQGAEVTAAIARAVRALRQSRGWSLDELSGRSGVSKGMVVQIEGARTNPSVVTLCRLADAFGVTVARLVEPGPPRRVRVGAASDAPLLWQGRHGGYARLLAGSASVAGGQALAGAGSASVAGGQALAGDPDNVELWEWRLEPADRHDSPRHAPGTLELLHVLGGTLTVTVDGKDHVVRVGETIDFPADGAHGYRNDGKTAVRMLMVVVMPPGDFDRRRR
jgi:transcriptional regulator with XRE-family HTH domain/quercetin dioxygenase-like cupin family protein